ncbi:MAG: metallophosphoesterase [Polyangiales bacterium]
MHALSPTAFIPLGAELLANALTTTWLRRRVLRSNSRWLRALAAGEVALVGGLLPLLSMLDAHLASPSLGALFGVAVVVNFACFAALPWIVAAELVARLTTRRDVPVVAIAAGDDPASEPLASARTMSRRETIATIGGLGSLAATSGPLLWGSFRTRLDVETIEIPIRIARLPKALDGFSIVQVSDIHVGPYLGERQLKVAEDIVARLRPDLVVATGDLVQHRAIYAPMAAAWLARLKALARHGIAVIPGNHEYYAGIEEVLGAVRRAGCDVLFNDARIVAPGDGGGFGLVGVDDLTGDKFPNGGPRLTKPLAKLRPDHARVLLCHQPSFHTIAAAFGFDLMLAGHTHGGQIAPVGPIVVHHAFRNVAGLSQIGDTSLYVNRGLGTSGPPTRVHIRPEITKIVLVAA